MKKSPILHDHCLIHVKHVERTLGLDSKHFQIFASSLTKFRKGMISNSALVSSVTNLFGPHDHLNECFQSFIPPKLQQSSNNHDHDVIHQQPSAKRPENSTDFSANIRRVTEFLNKVRERIKDDDPGVLKRFLDFLSTCYDKKDDHMAAAKEVQKEFDLVFKHHPDLSIDFTRFMVDFYITDESEEEAWESFKSGRKDESLYSLEEKHPCIEMLFKLDDDHCDYDVVCNILESTRRRIEKFYKKSKKQRGSQVAVKDFLSAVNLRCIEKLYGLTEVDGGYGQEIIEQLRINPIKASKIVKKRLKQKLKKLKREGAKAKLIWAEARKDCHMILKGDQLS